MSYLEAGITTVREMNGRPFLPEWRKRIEEGSLSGPTLYVASPTMGNFSSPREGYPTPTTAAEADSTVKRFVEQGYDWIKVYSFLPGDIFSAVIEAANKYGIPVYFLIISCQRRGFVKPGNKRRFENLGMITGSLL